MSSQVTVDTLSRMLRSARYHRFLQRSDGKTLKRGRSRMMMPCDAVAEIDRCYQIGIGLCKNDDDAACTLFDLAHLPLEMVLQRRQRQARFDEAALADEIYDEILAGLDD